MHFSKAEIQHLWFEYQNKYVRVLKANITNLQYSDDKKRWVDVKGGFWGFSHMLEVVDDTTVYNRLAVVDKHFDSLAEAKADYESFLNSRNTDFQSFCDEIFGDG